MTTIATVQSSVEILATFPDFPESAICDEVSQARVSIDEAMLAGPIHRAFIEMLPEAWRNDPGVEIFSRTVWLKEGWYPMAPSFHLDWGQDDAETTVETIMLCLGDASRTEFILGAIELPERNNERHGKVHWDELVAAGLSSGRLESWRIEPGKLIRFDNRTLHRAMPAEKTGWRMLIRAIRGLPMQSETPHAHSGTSPRQFTTCRNNFVPQTAAEKHLYRLYRD